MRVGKEYCEESRRFNENIKKAIRILENCAAGNRSIEVDCNGDVYLCGTFLRRKGILHW